VPDVLVGWALSDESGAWDGSATMPAVGGAAAESVVEAGGSLLPQATAITEKNRQSTSDMKM